MLGCFVSYGSGYGSALSSSSVIWSRDLYNKCEQRIDSLRGGVFRHVNLKKSMVACSASSMRGGAPEKSNPYRALGLSEGCSYDEVEVAVKKLKSKYSSDSSKVEFYERQKELVFEDKLRRRLSGEISTKIKESPYERIMRERKAEARKIVLPNWMKNLWKLPDLRQIQRSGIIMGVLLMGALLAPTIAGTSLFMGYAIAAAFLYNRGLPEPVKDEYGNVGEIQPVKQWALLRSLVIVAIACLFGHLFCRFGLEFIPLPASIDTESFTNAFVL
eukprot:CAMPEP_0182446366 /NCGR_PEP_ID=MMETSP1172-20130603/4157_1 /TAXON_ID=708627 /ORGANISM="Timspurckia oligopyrenoides, Strain CCMP3278" /LENGTH=272 /DNA_ID=CAMNT_0024642283 /DNA_START=69 /DNA_END=883 /DNA_ORIENTATION=+